MAKRTRLRALATAVTAAAAVLVATGQPTAAAPSDAPPTARKPAPLHRSANAVPGRYIVTLSKTTDPSAMMSGVGVKPLFTYKSAIRGFAADLTDAQLEQVRLTPGVEAVEEDATVTAVGSPEADTTRAPASSWGLDRIDQRLLPLDGDYTAKGSGQGVTAYILDTGIDYPHAEFGRRATFGFDAIGDGRLGQDCNGHGTHVAGTVAGKTYGVATKASLVSVRVLNCEGKGTWSGIIAGLDWVAANAQQPAVLNASLGGAKSTAVNSATDAVFDSGVLPVVAAGNSSEDACNISPASASGALTVGATNVNDQETDFSNFGRCLSMYAPGASIISAKLGGGTVALDGTSMASPHVAGVAALFKAQYPTANPGVVAQWLSNVSTPGVVTSISAGSPNRLLYTGGL